MGLRGDASVGASSSRVPRQSREEVSAGFEVGADAEAVQVCDSRPLTPLGVA